MRQSIHLTKTPDDVMLAWAETGAGPALVKASNWLSHLEYDWDSPVWSHWIRFFAEHFRFVRYDERGCGMSQWDVADISPERSSQDLQTIIEVARPEKPFVLLGISQGGAAAINYAIAHPANVSHLILYGCYVQGRAVRNDPEAEQRYRAIIALTRLGWGQNNPVYRQLFTSRFIPEANEEQIKWFNELCARTTKPEVAARIMESRLHVDLVDRLPQVAVPTLVLHARDDEAVPVSEGRLTAASIPNARFVELAFCSRRSPPGRASRMKCLHSPVVWLQVMRKIRSLRCSRRGNEQSWSGLPRASRTSKSAASCSSAKRPYATTSREFSKSSQSVRVRRRSCLRKIEDCRRWNERQR